MKQKILFLSVLLSALFHIVGYSQTTLPNGVIVPEGVEPPDNIVTENPDCYITPPASAWAIREVYPNRTTSIANYGLLMTGDIDNDGKTDIITHRSASSDYTAPGLNVFHFDNGAINLKYSITTNTINTQGSPAMVRYNNTVYVIIPGNDRYLYAYNGAIANSTANNYIWRSSVQFTSSGTTNVGIADFDNDGIPEVYAGNMIFSITDGTLICNGGSNNKGLYYYGSPIYSTFAVDFDGDGKLELLAGTQIYDVDIPSKTITLKTGWQLPSSELPGSFVSEGQAIPVDIDNDGILEVVVITRSGSARVLVWKPQANNQSKRVGYYSAAGSYHSTPMIGNIDDTPYLEIVFITDGGYMYALNYDNTKPMGERIAMKWRLSHSDNSGSTGATLFDFNQDGTNEIVYRDETQLRIIDGSGSSASVKSTFTNVRSGTVREYPIVADIDNDGEAEILVSGHTSSSGINGYLRVFKAGDNTAWAPARKVWNQYMYNVVNVNEDLTIPKTQFDITTEFPGKDGDMSLTADNVRPFNNFLQQQTTLNQDGVPLWITPRGEMIGTPAFIYDESSKKMTITLQVKNTGSNRFENPFYVSVFKDNIGNATSYTYEYQNTIDVGETVTFTFTLDNFDTTWMPHDFLIIKINAKADGATDQEVCDEDNTLFFYYGLIPTQQEACKDNINEIKSSFTDYSYYSYQWQYSIDDITWTDIAGVTTRNYKPTYQEPGIGYYRIKITDSSDPSNIVDHYTASIKVISRRCVMPVNPNIHIFK